MYRILHIPTGELLRVLHDDQFSSHSITDIVFESKKRAIDELKYMYWASGFRYCGGKVLPEGIQSKDELEIIKLTKPKKDNKNVE